MNALDFLKRQVGVFKDFSDEHLQQLLNGSRVISFEAGEAVAHEGAEATHFGVVLSGTVAASVQGDGGTRQPLGKLQAGGTFGEMALMTGDTLLADFIAESRCEVLLIPGSLFQSVIVAEPRAVRHISQTIAERIKLVFADPAKAAAPLQKSDDPFGLKLKGERPEKILVVNCGSSSLNFAFSTLLGPVFGSRLVEISKGTETLTLEHYQAGFKPLIYGDILALVLTCFLKETGSAVGTT